MAVAEQDILAGGLISTPDTSEDAPSQVRRIASKLNIAPDIADDYLQVTGGIESGNRQYGKSGEVLTGPQTRHGRARGFGQVMPDRPGGMTRTIQGKSYDLSDPDQNIEAGLKLFSAGGDDPVGRRLEYFGGQKARKEYERTGQIPQGGDGYTSFQQYVSRSMPGPKRGGRAAQPDILAGGLVSGNQPTPAPTPQTPEQLPTRPVLGPPETTEDLGAPPLMPGVAPATQTTEDLGRPPAMLPGRNGAAAQPPPPTPETGVATAPPTPGPLAPEPGLGAVEQMQADFAAVDQAFGKGAHVILARQTPEDRDKIIKFANAKNQSEMMTGQVRQSEAVADQQATLPQRVKQKAENLIIGAAVKDPENLARNLNWHFGGNILQEFQAASPAGKRQMIVLATNAAARDAALKQQTFKQTGNYPDISQNAKEQNENRRRVGLRPLGQPAPAAPPVVSEGQPFVPGLAVPGMSHAPANMADILPAPGGQPGQPAQPQPGPSRKVTNYGDLRQGLGLPPRVDTQLAQDANLATAFQGQGIDDLQARAGAAQDTQRIQAENAAKVRQFGVTHGRAPSPAEMQQLGIVSPETPAPQGLQKEPMGPSVLDTPEGQRQSIAAQARAQTAQTADELSRKPLGGLRRLLYTGTGETGPVVAGGLADLVGDYIHLIESKSPGSALVRLVAGDTTAHKAARDASDQFKALGAYLQASGDVPATTGAQQFVKSGAQFVGMAEKYGLAPGKVPFWAVMGAEAALKNQDADLATQSTEIGKGIVTGLFLQYGPGAVVKVLGRSPGVLGQFARALPVTTHGLVAGAGFGSAAAIGAYRNGDSWQQVVGAGLGAGVGAAALSLPHAAPEVGEAARAAAPKIIANERYPEWVREAVGTATGKRPVIFQSDHPDPNEQRFASVYVDPKTGEYIPREVTAEEASDLLQRGNRPARIVPDSKFNEVFGPKGGTAPPPATTTTPTTPAPRQITEEAGPSTEATPEERLAQADQVAQAAQNEFSQAVNTLGPNHPRTHELHEALQKANQTRDQLADELKTAGPTPEPGSLEARVKDAELELEGANRDFNVSLVNQGWSERTHNLKAAADAALKARDDLAAELKKAGPTKTEVPATESQAGQTEGTTGAEGAAPATETQPAAAVEKIVPHDEYLKVPESQRGATRGDAVLGPIKERMNQAQEEGRAVTFVYPEEGGKRVTGKVVNGMLEDAQGNRWGLAPMLFPKPGFEKPYVEIGPAAKATPTTTTGAEGFGREELLPLPPDDEVAAAAQGEAQNRHRAVQQRLADVPEPSKSQRSTLRQAETAAKKEFFTNLGYEPVSIGSGWGKFEETPKGPQMKALSGDQADQLWNARPAKAAPPTETTTKGAPAADEDVEEEGVDPRERYLALEIRNHLTARGVPEQAAGAFAKTLASAAHNRDTETLISALAPQNKGAREWFEERYAHIDLPKTEKGTAQAIRDWVAKNPKREPFLLHETKAGDKMMFQDMKGNREFYEVIDPDKRGMAKVRNLETGQVKDWNSGTNDFYHATPEELAGIKPPTVPPTETTTKGAPTLQVFRSGATSITDLQAYARAGAPIGIVAGNLSAEGLKTVVEHNAKGGHLFVDSGAFQAFRGGNALDFEGVMDRYDKLLAAVKHPENVKLVMPDKIGNQGASLDLVRNYADRIKGYINKGVDVIVPIQKGALDLSKAYDRVRELLGTDNFRVGVPSNQAAVSKEELGKFVEESKPSRIHLLGISEANRNFKPLVDYLHSIAPGLEISSDANRLRAGLGAGRKLTKEIEERVAQAQGEIIGRVEEGGGEAPDYTESVYDIYNTPGYLSPGEARQFAQRLSKDPQVQSEIVKAALAKEPATYSKEEEADREVSTHDSQLGKWLEENAPGDIGSNAVWQYLHGREHAATKQRTRGEVITDAERGAKEVDYGTPEKPNRAALANEYARAFKEGKRFTSIVEARAYAAELVGGRIEPGTDAAKAVDEAIEMGVVMDARARVAAGQDDEHDTYRHLTQLYGQQPNLGVRSSTSMEDQAYSTPVPLAYVADRLAGITENTSVYEITAGNGALLIGSNDDHIVANEKNPDRVAALKATYPNAKVTSHDALEDPDFGPVDRTIESVLANPPFGHKRELDDEGDLRPKKYQTGVPGAEYETSEVDHVIAFRALESMRDDGTAVLLLGGVNETDPEKRKKGYNEFAKRAFYHTLYNAYNVVDHFTASGDLYTKQGAKWPIDVVVIHGRGKSARRLPGAEAPRIYSNWKALEGVLDEPYRKLLDARRRESRNEPERGEPPAGGRGEGRPGELPGRGELPEPTGEPPVGPTEPGAGPRGGAEQSVEGAGGAGPAAEGGGIPDTEERPGLNRPGEQPGAVPEPDGGTGRQPPAEIPGERPGGRGPVPQPDTTGLAGQPAGATGEPGPVAEDDFAAILAAELAAMEAAERGAQPPAPAPRPAPPTTAPTERPPAAPPPAAPPTTAPPAGPRDLASVARDLDDLFARTKEPWQDSPEWSPTARADFTVENDNRIKLENRGAAVLLSQALEHGVSGTVVEDPKKLIQQLDALKRKHLGPERRADVVRFTAAVRDAARKTGVVRIYSKGNLAHEAVHEHALEATGRKRPVERYTAPALNDLTSGDTWKTLEGALARSGYPTWWLHAGDQATRTAAQAIYVEEAAANLAQAIDNREDKPLGLTMKQAVDYLDRWFTALAEVSGHRSLDKFTELTNEAADIRQAVYDRLAAAEGGQESVPDTVIQSLARRGEGGVSERGPPLEGRAAAGEIAAKEPDQMFAREGVDPEKYAKVKPLLEEGIAPFLAQGKNLSDSLKGLTHALRDTHGLPAQKIAAMTPYILQFMDEKKAEQEAPPEKPAERTQETVDITKTQAPYKPASGLSGGNTLVPVNMKSAVERALQSLIDRHGDIDSFVRTSLLYSPEEWAAVKPFFAEQVDGLGMSLDNLQKDSGMIIGDQGGIGKGRQLAGVIRYGVNQNRVVIFMTEKPALYKDIVRDLTGIGFGTTDDWTKWALMTNNNQTIWLDDEGKHVLRSQGSSQKKGQRKSTNLHEQKLEELMARGDLGGHKVIFTTYNQTQNTGTGEPTIRQRFLRQFAQDAIIVLDESHNAGGTGEQRLTAKQRQAMARFGPEYSLSRSRYIRDLLDRSHGVVYSSATYAKNPTVMDLYFKTNMRYAVPNPKDLAPMIERGGVPLQQVIAAMLAEDGQMIRRERDMSGLTYVNKTVKTDRELADRVAEGMRYVNRFDKAKDAAVNGMKNQLAEDGYVAGVPQSVGAAGITSVVFSSLMHNMVSDMSMMLKVDGIADEAIAAIKRGEKPVIVVAKTMGAFIEDYAKQRGLNPGDGIDVNFADVVQRYLDRSRTITIEDARGQKSKHYLTDAELGPHALNLYNLAKAYIESVDFSSMPISPIDYIKHRIEEAGYHIGEVTGRQHGIKYQTVTDPATGKKIRVTTYARRPSKELTNNARNKTMVKFNNDKDFHALLINEAGSTGVSVHASKDYRDQSPRHMIIGQPHLNIDTFMQTLYRVDRTGQVVPPSYTLLSGDIPAELRPSAILMKKMASLNANTTAAKGTGYEAKDTPDFMNKYGDQVMAQVLTDNPEWHDAMGRPLTHGPDGLDDDDAMRKASGYVTFLPIAEQEALYELVISEYNDLIARLDAMGENALEAKTLDLQARPVSRTEVFTGGGQDSAFARNAYAEDVDVRKLGKPYTPAEVHGLLSETLQAPPDSTMAQLRQLGHSQMRDQILPDARARFEEYGNAILGEIDDEDKRAAKAAQLNANHLLFRDRISPLTVGAQVQIVIGRGDELKQLNGVVTKVEQKGKPKNPLAMGSWKVTLAIPDATRSLTVPLSQILSSSLQDTVRTRVEGQLREVPMMDAFEHGQSDVRERRHMITGNLPGGYQRFMNGRIVNYSDDKGQVQQGILMPADFDLAREMDQRPVMFTNPEHVLQFLREGRRVVHSQDEHLNLQWDSNRLYLRTPKTGPGKQYSLARYIRDITGDFHSVGQRMQATASGDDARAVVQAILDNGVQLKTDTFKPEARRITGEQPPFTQQFPGQGGFFNPTGSPPPSGYPRPPGLTGSLRNLYDRIVGAVRVMRGQAPQERTPKKNFSVVGELRNIFAQNGSQLKKASQKAYEAFRQAAGGRSTGQQLMRRAANQIQHIYHTQQGWDDFRTLLTESRLKGVEGRWRDLQQLSLNLPDEELQDFYKGGSEEYETGVRPIIQMLEGMPFGKDYKEVAGKDPEYSVTGAVDSAFAADDYDTAQMLMATLFGHAANSVNHVMSDSDFQDGVNDPRFAQAIGVYQKLLEEPMKEAHSLNEGVFSDALGPLGTYYPLTALDEDGSPLHKVRTRVFRGEEFRVPENTRNRMATGLAPQYDTSAVALSRAVGTAERRNTTANLLRTLEKEGLVKRLKSKEEAPPYIFYGGEVFRAKAVNIGKDRLLHKGGKIIHVPAPRMLVPEWLHREVKPLLEDEDYSPGKFLAFLHTLNRVGMAGPLDAALHTSNVIGALVVGTPYIGTSIIGKTIGNTPVTKILTAWLKILQTDPWTDDAVDDIYEMTKLGVIPSRYATVTNGWLARGRAYAEQTGAKRKFLSLAPLLYGPAGVDIRARLIMYRLAKEMAPNASKTEIAHFMDQLGNYTNEMQSDLERWAKKYAIGAFATAGATMYRTGLKAAVGATPLPNATQSRARRAAQRAAVLFSGGFVGLIGTWVLMYLAYTGKYPWDDDKSKFLQIPLNKEHRQHWLAQAVYGKGDKTAYVGMGFFSPLIERGYRAAGLTAAIDALHAGATKGQASEEAVREIANSAIHPYISSPATQGGFVAATGKHPYWSQTRDLTGRKTIGLLAAGHEEYPGLDTWRGQAVEGVAAINNFYGDTLRNIGLVDQTLDLDKGRVKSNEDQEHPWVRQAVDLVAPRLIKGTDDREADRKRFERGEKAIETSVGKAHGEQVGKPKGRRETPEEYDARKNQESANQAIKELQDWARQETNQQRRADLYKKIEDIKARTAAGEQVYNPTQPSRREERQRKKTEAREARKAVRRWAPDLPGRPAEQSPTPGP